MVPKLAVTCVSSLLSALLAQAGSCMSTKPSPSLSTPSEQAVVPAMLEELALLRDEVETLEIERLDAELLDRDDKLPDEEESSDELDELSMIV